MKRLNELYDCDYDTEIKDIKINSKDVEKGDIFVCTMGVSADRHDYIPDAIKNGCSAIVVSKDVNYDIPTIKVKDTNEELSLLASKFYDHPEKAMDLIGITGTNGKTTVATMIQHMIGNDLCGYIGTNGIICSKFNETIRNTTPDADRLFKYFDRFRKSGCKIISMETSSEALYRNRLNNIEFKIGIVTNITEDHLNIHKTIENYVTSKKKLLDKIKDDGVVILNSDDNYYEEFKAYSKNKVLSYGKKDSTLQIIESKPLISSTLVKLKYNSKEYEFEVPFLGEFNTYNLCAAMLALIVFGYDIEDVIKRVNNIKTPAGRVQFINHGQNYRIVLDYAHTTDAFNNLFKLLKNLPNHNRIITLTGSAGGREKTKRPLMGESVLNNSDYVIFTMDDPRDIIMDLVSTSNKTNYEVIVDRKEAIYKCFDMAKENDIVLIAGKGVDNYMAIGDKYLPYCDLDVINGYFEEKGL